MTSSPSPSSLSNNPPPDDVARVDLESMVARINERVAHLRERLLHLIERAKTVTAAPTDDETAGRIADFVLQLQSSMSKWEVERVFERGPILRLGQAIQDAFVPLNDDAAIEAERLKELLIERDGVRGEFGALVSVRAGVIEIEVVDGIDRVPYEYLMVDCTKVKREWLDNRRDITGLKITEKKRTQVR